MDTVIKGPTYIEIVRALLFDRHTILEFEVVGKGKIRLKLKGFVPAKDKGVDLLILSTRKIPEDWDLHSFLHYNMKDRNGTFADPKSIAELEKLLQT